MKLPKKATPIEKFYTLEQRVQEFKSFLEEAREGGSMEFERIKKQIDELKKSEAGVLRLLDLIHKFLKQLEVE